MKNGELARTASHHVPPGRGRCSHAPDGRSGSSSRDRGHRRRARGQRAAQRSGRRWCHRRRHHRARDGRIKVGDRLRGIESEGGEVVEFRGKSPRGSRRPDPGPCQHESPGRRRAQGAGRPRGRRVDPPQAAGYGVVAHRVKTRTPVTIDPAALDPLVGRYRLAPTFILTFSHGEPLLHPGDRPAQGGDALLNHTPPHAAKPALRPRSGTTWLTHSGRDHAREHQP